MSYHYARAASQEINRHLLDKFSAASITHRHLWIIDCLTARTACLVCFISTVNGHNKKRKEKKAIMGCARSGHITNLSNLFLPFDIYGITQAESSNHKHNFGAVWAMHRNIMYIECYLWVGSHFWVLNKWHYNQVQKLVLHGYLLNFSCLWCNDISFLRCLWICGGKRVGYFGSCNSLMSLFSITLVLS